MIVESLLILEHKNVSGDQNFMASKRGETLHQHVCQVDLETLFYEDGLFVIKPSSPLPFGDTPQLWPFISKLLAWKESVNHPVLSWMAQKLFVQQSRPVWSNLLCFCWEG